MILNFNSLNIVSISAISRNIDIFAGLGYRCQCQSSGMSSIRCICIVSIIKRRPPIFLGYVKGNLATKRRQNNLSKSSC